MFNQIPLYAGKRIQAELIPRAAIFAHLKNLTTCNVSILMNKKAQLETKGCLSFTNRFQKIRLESKWHMTLLVVPAENFREREGSSQKVVPFFRTECSTRIIVFLFFKTNFDTSFRLLRPFYGKWNWFVQMVNAIPGGKFPIPNFAYHLSKPWTKTGLPM